MCYEAEIEREADKFIPISHSEVIEWGWWGTGTYLLGSVSLAGCMTLFFWRRGEEVKTGVESDLLLPAFERRQLWRAVREGLVATESSSSEVGNWLVTFNSGRSSFCLTNPLGLRKVKRGSGEVGIMSDPFVGACWGELALVSVEDGTDKWETDWFEVRGIVMIHSEK